MCLWTNAIINNVRKTIIRDQLTDPRFYAQMQQHYPTWREARGELNELPLTAEVWRVR